MSARYLYALPRETHDDDNGDGDDDDGTTRATPPLKILELRAGLVDGGRRRLPSGAVGSPPLI